MRTIVVGVDDTPGSAAALAWAVEEARLHGARLQVLHAFGVPPDDTRSLTAVAAYSLDSTTLERATAQAEEVRRREYDRARQLAEAEVAAIIAAAAPAHADVEIETVVVANVRPARVLVQASGDADLLVVGSRGRGSVAGLVLGSVSQQCLHHAACPVAVIRPGED